MGPRALLRVSVLATALWGARSLDPGVRRAVLWEEPLQRLQALGRVGNASGVLSRPMLSEAHQQAAELLLSWMRDAGLEARIDVLGNVRGRLAGARPHAPALLLGSHYDTVVDAGAYDGTLGVLAAIAALKALVLEEAHRRGLVPEGQAELGPGAQAACQAFWSIPVEVLAFSDEEGVRFHTTFLGSRAAAGTLALPDLHAARDAGGATLAAALGARWGRPVTQAALDGAALRREEVGAYVEVHLEQGPVLLEWGLALGPVSAVAGQLRLAVEVRGEQGHAGCVPMALRKDALAAAAELVTAVERQCTGDNQRGHSSQQSAAAAAAVAATAAAATAEAGAEETEAGLVCTVGKLDVRPGASNVIPGLVTFTVDIRAGDDALRDGAAAAFEASVRSVCGRRGLPACSVERVHEAASLACPQGLGDELARAASRAMQDVELLASAEGGDTQARSGADVDAKALPRLVSGAGHDLMAMAALTDQVGLLFVRDTGGVSHAPGEYVAPADVAAASLALFHFLRGRLGEGPADRTAGGGRDEL